MNVTILSKDFRINLKTFINTISKIPLITEQKNLK